MVQVWDVFVRFSHWAIALGFVVAYLTEDDLLVLHVWAGYAVGVLVVLRLIWGLVGPRHARFTDFLYRPKVVRAYLTDLLAFRAERHLGHSPAGGAMAIALWLGLLAAVWSGLELYAAEEGRGPLAAAAVEDGGSSASRTGLLVLVNEENEDDNDNENASEGAELWEGIHEIVADVVLFLVFLHVAGVALTCLVHRENLVRAMLTGRKRAE